MWCLGNTEGVMEVGAVNTTSVNNETSWKNCNKCKPKSRGKDNESLTGKWPGMEACLLFETEIKRKKNESDWKNNEGKWDNLRR